MIIIKPNMGQSLLEILQNLDSELINYNIINNINPDILYLINNYLCYDEFKNIIAPTNMSYNAVDDVLWIEWKHDIYCDYCCLIISKNKIEFSDLGQHKDYFYFINNQSQYNIRVLYNDLLESDAISNNLEIKVYKQKLADNTICVISLEYINTGESYGKCGICNVCFKFDMILNWLSICKKCPHCRCMMSKNRIIKYINLNDGENII